MVSCVGIENRLLVLRRGLYSSVCFLTSPDLGALLLALGLLLLDILLLLFFFLLLLFFFVALLFPAALFGCRGWLCSGIMV